MILIDKNDTLVHLVFSQTEAVRVFCKIVLLQKRQFSFAQNQKLCTYACQHTLKHENIAVL